MSNIKTLATGRSDVYMLPPEDIHIRDGWNARNPDDPDNAQHVEQLAKSIAEVGVKTPLTGYMDDGKFYVTDGHSRTLAVRLALSWGHEIKGVPVRTEERTANEADRVFSQIVRNSGKPLTPYEMGSVFKRLLAFGWTVTEIATKSGVASQYVNDLLSLQAADMGVQSLVKTGQVSATLAISTMKQRGNDAPGALNQAVEAAHAAGKTRATKKHLPGVKVPSKMEELRELLSVNDRFSSGYHDGAYLAVFTPDEYAKLRSIVGF